MDQSKPNEGENINQNNGPDLNKLEPKQGQNPNETIDNFKRIAKTSSSKQTAKSKASLSKASTENKGKQRSH